MRLMSAQTKADCPDPWHADPSTRSDTYVVSSGSVLWEGYTCPTCGFQTVTVDQVAEEDMIPRVCPDCGTDYLAMPDSKGGLCWGEEFCQACLTIRLNR